MNQQIDADRRRKGPGPTGRADAPRRDVSGGGGMPRPSFGGASRGTKIGGCGTALIVLLFIVYFLLSNGQGLIGQPQDETWPQATQDMLDWQQTQPTLPPSNYTPPAPAATGNQTWTILLYQDADDQVLEQDIYLDLNEAERVGSSENVHIVAQIDRFRAAYAGDGDWTSARRYYVTRDADLNRVGSQLLQELGEVDMASPNTLVDFVTWGVQNYPADHYVLILSDHGMGWPGGWSDPSHRRSGGGGIPLVDRLGNQLYLMELSRALEQARSAAGIDRFELIGMDACLMAQLEVMTALQPYAHYAVASEEVEPAIGWAYASFLAELVQNPEMSGADLSKAIVNGYIIEDQRVQDPAARAEFLRGGSPLDSFFGGGAIASADQLAAQLGRDATLTAVDLDALPAFLTQYNHFSYQLQSEDQALVAQARSYAQSYTSIFGREVPPSYIDLGHFVSLLRANTSNAAVQQSADEVLKSLRQLIVAEKHGAARKGSMGLTVYFPNSTLYRSPIAGPQSYTRVADRFAALSLWDDFLAYHYLDRGFEDAVSTPYVPAGNVTTRAPGAGRVTLSNLRASTASLNIDQSVKLSVDVQGSQIGYVYLFVGYYDAAANSLNVTDIDFLESPDTRKVNDVFYPVWPDDGFTLNFTWQPTVFAIRDGRQDAVALFQPDQYGAAAEDATYTVEGVYTFVQTGEQQNAQLVFQDGKLVRVLGFSGEAEAGAPREITPAVGDTFTLREKWLDLDANGAVRQTVQEDGPVLTFGTQPFEWVQLYAAAGEYVIGFIVEDLDGNAYPVYRKIVVQ